MCAQIVWASGTDVVQRQCGHEAHVCIDSVGTRHMYDIKCGHQAQMWCRGSVGMRYIYDIKCGT